MHHFCSSPGSPCVHKIVQRCLQDSSEFANTGSGGSQLGLSADCFLLHTGNVLVVETRAQCAREQSSLENCPPIGIAFWKRASVPPLSKAFGMETSLKPFRVSRRDAICWPVPRCQCLLGSDYMSFCKKGFGPEHGAPSQVICGEDLCCGSPCFILISKTYLAVDCLAVKAACMAQPYGWWWGGAGRAF